jgi:hypothetical protein
MKQQHESEKRCAIEQTGHVDFSFVLNWGGPGATLNDDSPRFVKESEDQHFLNVPRRGHQFVQFLST